MMKLYNFYPSSASFRVRIALNLKGVEYEYVSVPLRREGGGQDTSAYRALNPQGLVPTLVDGDVTLTQSLAIFEYLEETRPEPPLLPRDAAGRARVRGLALHVACEMQPLNNLRVERHLANTFGADEGALRAWRLHWITVGFDALESVLAKSPSTGRYCHGDAPTVADCCLVPQVANSQRSTVALDLSPFPTVKRIYETCLEHAAFQKALPKNQPDAKDLRA